MLKNVVEKRVKFTLPHPSRGHDSTAQNQAPAAECEQPVPGILSVQLQQEVRGATEKLRDFYENFHGRKDIVVFPVAYGLLGNI